MRLAPFWAVPPLLDFSIRYLKRFLHWYANAKDTARSERNALYYMY